MATTDLLKGVQAKGVQKWTHFVGGTANEDILQVKVGGAGFVQAGLALSSNMVSGEKVEIDTVV
jgi:hypothetical protein